MQWIQSIRAAGRRWAAIVLCLAGVVGVFIALRSDERESIASEVNTQVWIDTSGQAFEHELRVGETAVVGPTGKPAFRAELCYWTADGRTKTKPTPVLLNTHLGLAEPTFCPDCQRLVTPLNRVPLPGLPDAEQKAPPTRAQYASR